MSETIGQLLCRAFGAPPKTISVTVEAHCQKLVRVTFLHYAVPVRLAASKRTAIRRTTVRTFAPGSRRLHAAQVAAKCPECSKVSTLAELFARAVNSITVHCPHCDIGSPAREWRAP